ncbi:MAG TPA: hypothetical protein VFI91_06745 [Longimicrobiaceae bacterium]|nr:hypothetical protein [Longimicrobiaceae bacterium]
MESRVPYEPAPSDDAEPHGPPAMPEVLTWHRQKMVRWFNPIQLAHTGAQALLSGIFGTYADKREMQAALSHDHGKPAIHDFSGNEDLWLDYTADLGDGFDSTYSIAWTLSREHPEGDEAEALALTKRGDILILGGDQVYPTASREEYLRRFAGPYEAALPWLPEPERPTMFAIPGNHDWYDGLTSFIRLFCQRRSIGAWRTRQSRSYFALELPHRWWLLGIDIQLGADLDKPQLDYFEHVAEKFQPGDQVILCTAQPAWVHATKEPRAYDNLVFFERKIICPRGANLMLTLTGDLHHYARYADSGSVRHKITSGGGGAYLYGTHRLPTKLELPKADEAESGIGEAPDTKTYDRETIYPDKKTSLRLRFGALLLGIRNPYFIMFLGFAYTMYAWMLQSASRVHLEEGTLTEWLSTRSLADLESVFITILQITVRAPLLAATVAFLIYALYQFCAPDRGRPKWFRWFGAVHAVVHLVLILALAWLFAWFNMQVLGIDVLEFGAIAFFLEMVLIGGPVGALIFGIALLPGVNFNEAYSSQHGENYKNFLRLHIGESGKLIIYPVGIDRVVEWEINRDALPGDPYFRPREGVPPRARLIEKPIVMTGPTPSVPSPSNLKETS